MAHDRQQLLCKCGGFFDLRTYLVSLVDVVERPFEALVHGGEHLRQSLLGENRHPVDLRRSRFRDRVGVGCMARLIRARRPRQNVGHLGRISDERSVVARVALIELVPHLGVRRHPIVAGFVVADEEDEIVVGLGVEGVTESVANRSRRFLACVDSSGEMEQVILPCRARDTACRQMLHPGEPYHGRLDFRLAWVATFVTAGRFHHLASPADGEHSCGT